MSTKRKGKKRGRKKHEQEEIHSDLYLYDIDETLLCHSGTQLYKAKVIQRVIKSNHPLYLIHYHGWNKIWDEWLSNARCLKYTPSNIAKMKRLQHKNTNNKPNITKDFEKCCQCNHVFCADNEGGKCSSCASYFCAVHCELYGDKYLCNDCDCQYKHCDRCLQICFESCSCNICHSNVCKSCKADIKYCDECDIHYCNECLWNISNSKTNNHYKHIIFSFLMGTNDVLGDNSSIYTVFVNNRCTMDTRAIFKHLFDFIGYDAIAYNECLLSLNEIKELKPYDVVDLRSDIDGEFTTCKVKRIGDKTCEFMTLKKSEYDSYGNTTITIQMDKMGKRIARGYSITQRAVHRLNDLNVGDSVDINPRNQGWVKGKIWLDTNNQVCVKYEITRNGDNTLHWTHRDNENEIRYQKGNGR